MAAAHFVGNENIFHSNATTAGARSALTTECLSIMTAPVSRAGKGETFDIEDRRKWLCMMDCSMIYL